MTRLLAPAALAALVTLLPGGRASRAQPSGEGGTLVQVEARFVDPATGLEAGWGATGQVLIPPQPTDHALQRWQQARSVATSLARQQVTLPPGGGGLIRVGRGIPFAGWFLRHGTSCGLLEQDVEWREVESALELEAGTPGADGSVALTLTPEFSYLAGRSRNQVVFSGERAQLALTPGVEARFAPDAELAPFYARLLAGYDPVRRVWPVELLLRVDLVDAGAGDEGASR